MLYATSIHSYHSISSMCLHNKCGTIKKSIFLTTKWHKIDQKLFIKFHALLFASFLSYKAVYDINSALFPHNDVLWDCIYVCNVICKTPSIPQTDTVKLWIGMVVQPTDVRKRSDDAWTWAWNCNGNKLDEIILIFVIIEFQINRTDDLISQVCVSGN